MLVIFNHVFIGFRHFIVFLNCILSKNIILTIMHFKISDTIKGNKQIQRIYVPRLDSLVTHILSYKNIYPNHMHFLSVNA